MNLEIENLINMALADGEVTDKERAIIFRKTESLGEDIDEIEMILDGRIALMKKEQNQSSIVEHPKSNKEGIIKKCPSCGAPVKSFTTKCLECDHEFLNIQSEKSINELFIMLQDIEQEERNKPRKKSFASMLGDMDLEKEYVIANRQSVAISTFPVPNSKESILEFLSLAVPQTKIKLQTFLFMTANVDKGKETIKNSWKSKCEQVIIKARFSMKDDQKTLAEIEAYAKQLKIK